MRKLMLLVLTALAPLSTSFADNDIGCGVGTILWEGQSGVFAKSLAATTNGILGNQTFGVSSGTLECQQGGVITAAARLPMYAGANLDQLAADMAAGQGEALATLAELYAIPQADRTAFYAITRSNFAVLFPADDTTAGQMLATLDALMRKDDRLAIYVS